MLMRDERESPLERAVWWVEYMARHRGAPHLRPASRDLPPHQLYLLDVYLLVFVAASVWTVVFTVLAYYFVAKRAWRRVFGRGGSSERRRSSNLSTGGGAADGMRRGSAVRYAMDNAWSYASSGASRVMAEKVAFDKKRVGKKD
jgi:hypothetical protein